jgi:hypothetical protein
MVSKRTTMPSREPSSTYAWQSPLISIYFVLKGQSRRPFKKLVWYSDKFDPGRGYHYFHSFICQWKWRDGCAACNYKDNQYNT